MTRMKTSINSSIILTCLLFTLSSCSDNNIYFDINNQSVRSCNKKVISKLHIISKNNNDFYFFSKKPEAEGTNNFSLFTLNHSYFLENMNSQICIDSFKLMPETEYEITNSTFGDADRTQILIKTDKEGKVIYSNVTSCKLN